MFGTIPPTADHRWDLVRLLASRWFPGRGRMSGYVELELLHAERRLGVPLPRELKRWYLSMAADHELWCVQDRLLSPNRLFITDGLLVFLAENQDCAHWGIPLDSAGLDDPPVSLLIDGAEHPLESPSVSCFALQYLMLNIKFSGSLVGSANGQATDDAIAEIRRTLPRIPVYSRGWPQHGAEFFGTESLVVEVDANTWVWVASLDLLPFDRFVADLQRMGMTWESVLTT